MNTAFSRAVLASEWTKIRTVRSTTWNLALTFVLSAGLGTLVALSLRANIDRAVNFDPAFAGLYSLTLGQLGLVVFGVLLVGSEYSSGTIRTSLAAVPRRGVFFSGKVLAGALVALVVAAATVIVTFVVAQTALGPYRTTMGADGVPARLGGACVYLTLICVFSMGVATMLRSSAVSLGILLPLLFLGSQGLGNVPALKSVLQYLPDQAGLVLMHLTGPQDDPRFGHGYGPWGALMILLAWTAASLLGGYLTLCRRDA
ncbi:ABC transporter [Streptomyces nigrescens]|uniref:ABC transporter n=1 Tax=Streptomyces nigrescens TaxID=1920 RepID=A0ABM7ZTV2_STRNI|nr:ABC transporter permease subunit [Streptomyces nigrescens]BDM69812.1 ABC transporter [Streptomyces nigrescens]